MNPTDKEIITILIVLLVAALAIPLLLMLLVKLRDLRQELEYINMEIRRSTGRSLAYWKKKRRQLWLSLLPFYRGKK